MIRIVLVHSIECKQIFWVYFDSRSLDQKIRRGFPTLTKVIKQRAQFRNVFEEIGPQKCPCIVLTSHCLLVAYQILFNKYVWFKWVNGEKKQSK